MLIVSLVTAGLLLFYTGLMLVFTRYWRQTPEIGIQEAGEYPEVAVIIPARNEETHIARCLQSILQQEGIDWQRVEIIVADDGSSDGTANEVKHMQALSPVNIRCFTVQRDSRLVGAKKQAIAQALQHTRARIIVTTDADCVHGDLWLKTMLGHMVQHNLHLVSGPVMFTARNMFERMQQLEFAGLVAIGGGCMHAGKPNMCNGANLAYTREAFDAVGGFTGNEHLASGDDEFLMHKIARRYPQQYNFLKSKEALVYTAPSASIREFYRQRKRWVSKTTSYERKSITLILIMAYLVNLWALALPVIGIYFPALWCLVLLYWLGKTLAELWLFIHVLPFFRRMRLIWLIPLAEPFHVLYVLVIGIAGQTGSYEWKGRKGLQ